MSLTIKSFSASDAGDARRLVIDHFFVLRRQRLVSAVIKSPYSYLMLAAVAMSTYLVSKSLRLASIVAALGPLSGYLYFRLAFYLFENFKYRDMATDKKFVSYWLPGDNKRKLCVVRDDKTGTLVGLGGLSNEGEEGVVELKRMVVHSDYRRRGIARLMLNCLLGEYAKEMKAHTVMLITQATQHESFKLYKDAGFTVYKRRGIGSYFMRIDLKTWKSKAT